MLDRQRLGKKAKDNPAKKNVGSFSITKLFFINAKKLKKDKFDVLDKVKFDNTSQGIKKAVEHLRSWGVFKHDRGFFITENDDYDEKNYPGSLTGFEVKGASDIVINKIKDGIARSISINNAEAGVATIGAGSGDYTIKQLKDGFRVNMPTGGSMTFKTQAEAMIWVRKDQAYSHKFGKITVFLADGSEKVYSAYKAKMNQAPSSKPKIQEAYHKYVEPIKARQDALGLKGQVKMEANNLWLDIMVPLELGILDESVEKAIVKYDAYIAKLENKKPGNEAKVEYLVVEIAPNYKNIVSDLIYTKAEAQHIKKTLVKIGYNPDDLVIMTCEEYDANLLAEKSAIFGEGKAAVRYEGKPDVKAPRNWKWAKHGYTLVYVKDGDWNSRFDGQESPSELLCNRK